MERREIIRTTMDDQQQRQDPPTVSGSNKNQDEQKNDKNEDSDVGDSSSPPPPSQSVGDSIQNDVDETDNEKKDVSRDSTTHHPIGIPTMPRTPSSSGSTTSGGLIRTSTTSTTTTTTSITKQTIDSPPVTNVSSSSSTNSTPGSGSGNATAGGGGGNGNSTSSRPPAPSQPTLLPPPGSNNNTNSSSSNSNNNNPPPPQSTMLPPRRENWTSSSSSSQVVSAGGGDDSSSVTSLTNTSRPLAPPAPVHNFFQQNQYNPYDSDGSDGSLVFSPTTPTAAATTSSGAGGNGTSPALLHPPPLTPAANANVSSNSSVGSAARRHEFAAAVAAAHGGGGTSRDRLNSTDSFQSTGSILYVSSPSQSQSESNNNNNNNNNHRTSSSSSSRPATSRTSGSSSNQRQSHGSSITTTTTSTNIPPSPPRVLPYHERLKQKQGQNPNQQRQHQQQQPPPMNQQQQQQMSQPFQHPHYPHHNQQQQQQQSSSADVMLMMQQQQQFQQQQFLMQQHQQAVQAAYFAQLQQAMAQNNSNNNNNNNNSQAQASQQQVPPPQPPQSQQKRTTIESQTSNSQPQPTTSSSTSQQLPTMYPSLPPMDPAMVAAYYQQMYGMFAPHQHGYNPASMFPPSPAHQIVPEPNEQQQQQQNLPGGQQPQQQVQQMPPMFGYPYPSPHYPAPPPQQQQQNSFSGPAVSNQPTMPVMMMMNPAPPPSYNMTTTTTNPEQQQLQQQQPQQRQWMEYQQNMWLLQQQQQHQQPGTLGETMMPLSSELKPASVDSQMHQQDQQKHQQRQQRHRHKRSDSSGFIPPMSYSIMSNTNSSTLTAGQEGGRTTATTTRLEQPIGSLSSEATPIITNIKNSKTGTAATAATAAIQSNNTRPGSFSSAGSNLSVPPPPPPTPHQQHPSSEERQQHRRSNSSIVHVRSDSVGSMSSLGSSGGFGNRGSYNQRDSLRSTTSIEEEELTENGQMVELLDHADQISQQHQQDHRNLHDTKHTVKRDSNSSAVGRSVSFETPPQPSNRKTASNNSTVVTTTNNYADSMSTPEALRETVSHSRKNSFLDMLRLGWSPKSQEAEKRRPTIDDFHRKNQEFLQSKQQQQQHQQRTMAFPSFPALPHDVQPSHRRLGSQDRPPPSWGTHRRLSSIPQHPDGWNDGDDLNSSDSISDDGNKKPAASTTDGRNRTGIKLKRPPPPPPPPPPQPLLQSASSSISVGAHRAPQRIDINPSFETTESNSTPDSQYRYTDDEEEATPADRKYYGYGVARPDGDHSEDEDISETTSLLPAAGISSNEQDGKTASMYGMSQERGGGRRNNPSSGYDPSPRSDWSSDSSRGFSSQELIISSDAWGRRTARLMSEAEKKTKKSKKKKYRRRSMQKATVGSDPEIDDDDDDESDGEEADMDYRAWTMKRATMLEKERSKMIEQWKQEARAEAELLRQEEVAKQPHRRCWSSFVRFMAGIGSKSFRCLTRIEMFVANLPLTIGAVAMAVVTLGVVWFKFAEEYLGTCEPVHFHSSQCTFPEFPGCFYCDQSVIGYKIALAFHYGCKVTAGFLAMLVVAKVLLATRVVMDEMSSPTTSSPAGLMCMTACVVYAGRGLVGQIMVTIAACGHLCLVIWFIYMALAYRIMPEPSWFPNTVGVGLSAVKTWLYYPMPGHLLMAISLLLNFFFFPISLIRVAANKKISATVGWMQMSAPAISLYALTIMAQPSFEEEHPDVTNFQRVHRMVYLPCMHVMCALTIIGMGASLHSLWVRWTDFSKRSFGPAHAAFAFPTLSHANAIQAYRGAVMSFSGIPSRTWPFFILDAYWMIVLIGGTVATFWICGKFLYHLPEWTSPDLMDEEEPPAPYDTLLSKKDMVTVGDHLTQPFVSPAIIQANETGALVMARDRRDGTMHYVRTRRIGALGFEPTMNWNEMQEEAEALLEWVGKHPPRRRHRTLSVPGIDFSYGSSQPFGTGNTGVYGTMPQNSQSHNRHMTLGANDTRILF